MLNDQSHLFPMPAITSLRGHSLRVMMIEYYFDDSGTHETSPVVLWAGIAGRAENFDYLDARWREFLAEPSAGRPPISSFSLSKCKARRPPFDQYDDLAIAGARRRSGQIIIDSGVSPVGFGIDRNAWNSIVGKIRNKDAGSPDRMAFGLCAKAVLSDAESLGEKVKMHFDRGQDAIIRGVIEDAESLFPEIGSVVEYSSLAVAVSTGLQAADTVANEFYGFATKWVADNDAKPGDELAAIIDGATESRMRMMGATQIATMLEAIDSASQQPK